MLVTIIGCAFVPSTPLGRNWFRDLYSLGLDPEESKCAFFHYSTAANRFIGEENLQNIRHVTPAPCDHP